MLKRKREPVVVTAVGLYGPRSGLLGLKNAHPTLRLWVEIHKYYTLYWIADFHGSKKGVALTLAGAARRYKRQEAKRHE